MTYKTGNTIVLEVEPPRKCEFCGLIRECRPYGPNNEQICYECAMKDIETTNKKINELFDGPPTVSTDRN